MYKTIRQNFAAVCGRIYRMTSDGATVRIEGLSPKIKGYETLVEMPLSVYETIVEETTYDTESDTWLHNLANGRA